MASARSDASSAIDSSIEWRRRPLYAVILAGGSGTRLWPLARAAWPKQFLPLFGGVSLFQLTWNRLRTVVPPSRVLVVCGAAHVPLVRAQAPVPRSRILVETRGRNTAASVALAALWIQKRSPHAVMMALPSDHWIERTAAFRSALRRGASFVARRDGLLTMGVPPAGPATGFGYIGPCGKAVEPGVRVAEGFVEKPATDVARRLIRTGRVYWNCGIFVWRVGSLLEALRAHRPSVLAPLLAWVRKGARGPWTVPRSVLDRVEALPIDRAVLETSRELVVMRASFGWSDLGHWDALAEILGRDRRGQAAIGDTLALGSRRCLAFNEGGTTVFVGVENLLAVRSGRVVLVSNRASANRMREVVARLARARPHLA